MIFGRSFLQELIFFKLTCLSPRLLALNDMLVQGLLLIRSFFLSDQHKTDL